MLRKIIAKELRETGRDRRRSMALCIIPLLLVVALALNWYEARVHDGARRDAQTAARENWLNQGKRSGHSAAHYGTFVFKPLATLSFFDPGLDPYLGTSIRVEAHDRHRAANLPAIDSADPLRFDASSAALLLQVVLPLAVILLGFSGVSGEREAGTLPLLLGLGVPPWKLLLGKAAAILVTTAVLASPVALFLAWALVGDDATAPRTDLPIKAALLAVGYAAYLGGWAFLTLATSARAGSSRAALVVLLAVWAVSTLLVPRLATDAAVRLHPLPTQEEFERKVTSAIHNGPDGKTRLFDLYKVWEADLLKKYGVAKKEELPVNLDGMLMLLGEEHADRFHDEADAGLRSIFERQDRLVGWCSLASPYLAVRAASMALAGTDWRHHERFVRSVEMYRRGLIKALNEADARKRPGGAGEGGESGRALWEKMADFRYDAPDWMWAARMATPGLVLLVAWFALAALLALSSHPRPRGTN